MKIKLDGIDDDVLADGEECGDKGQSMDVKSNIKPLDGFWMDKIDLSLTNLPIEFNNKYRKIPLDKNERSGKPSLSALMERVAELVKHTAEVSAVNTRDGEQAFQEAVRAMTFPYVILTKKRLLDENISTEFRGFDKGEADLKPVFTLNDAAPEKALKSALKKYCAGLEKRRAAGEELTPQEIKLLEILDAYNKNSDKKSPAGEKQIIDLNKFRYIHKIK